MHDDHPLVGQDILAGDVRLYVTEYGAGTGTVLFLHGLPSTSYLWHAVARYLEHDVRCVMPDLVGLGSTERPQQHGDYGTARQAATMLALLDVLGVDRGPVVGHGVGATIALEMALLAPERVTALGLISPLVYADSWPPPVARPLLLPGLGELMLQAMRRSPRAAAEVLRRALGPDLTPAEVAQYLATLHEPGGPAAFLRVLRAVDPAAAQASLPALAALPTLVLWGEDDPVLPVALGHRLTGELPGATWVPIAAGTHLLPTAMAERVAEELRGFLAEVSSGR